MKMLIFIGILFSSLHAMAADNCNITVVKNRTLKKTGKKYDVHVGAQLRTTLTSKGFHFVSNENKASYKVSYQKQCSPYPNETQCEYTLDVSTLEGHNVYLHGLSTKGLMDVLQARGKQKAILSAESIYCKNGELTYTRL